VRHAAHARRSTEANGKGSGCLGARGLGEATGARLDFGMTPDRDLANFVIEPDGICSNLITEHRETAVRCDRHRPPEEPVLGADLAGKLSENMAPFAGAERTTQLIRCLDSIETLRSVRDMTALLAPATSGADSAKTE
jgi:hypothetical protein